MRVLAKPQPTKRFGVYSRIADLNTRTAQVGAQYQHPSGPIELWQGFHATLAGHCKDRIFHSRSSEVHSSKVVSHAGFALLDSLSIGEHRPVSHIGESTTGSVAFDGT